MAGKKKQFTLVFVLDESRILLGLKKRGFGCGRWNGFGGKVEAGETIAEAAKRELNEECGLIAEDLQKVAVIDFEFVDSDPIMEVHLFKTHKYTGKPVETEEMKPQWFELGNVPFDQMWPDDRLWFPYLLSGRAFQAYFKFRGQDTILEHNITEDMDNKCIGEKTAQEQ